jgi:hypothetical protein
MTALERHGHWHDDPDLRQMLLQISPATIDRLLAPFRSAQGGQHRSRCKRVVTGVRRRATERALQGVVGQQMEAIRDKENSHLTAKS